MISPVKLTDAGVTFTILHLTTSMVYTVEALVPKRVQARASIRSAGPCQGPQCSVCPLGSQCQMPPLTEVASLPPGLWPGDIRAGCWLVDGRQPLVEQKYFSILELA